MKIGKVTVLRELGTGAGSRVSLVRRETDSCEYALKVASVGSKQTRKYLAQFRNEYRVAGLFDHTNLIQVYCLETDAGWFTGPKTVTLLSEYASGQTIDLLPLQPVERLVWAFEQVADAIAHMHSRGVIHADLKPNNLVLDSDGGIKVIDFGISQLAGERRGRLVATPEFMAPETATRRLLNAKTDIYSLGVTMYRLATLHFPPACLDTVMLGQRGFDRQYQSVEGLNPAVPSELSELIRECLRFDPDHRPANMEELRARLESIGRSLSPDG
jgi:serine/threonine protein kinase